MEKMSVSKPAMKRMNISATPATLTQSTLTRSPSIPLESAGEKGRLIASPLTQQVEVETETTQKKMSHPKGHKVRELKEVWENMDKQNYLHLTDTLTLGDVWIQPLQAIPEERGSFVTVGMSQILDAPHIKSRNASCKMSTDDLLKMLYLNDRLQADMAGRDSFTFDDWLNAKAATAVKTKGIETGSDHRQLCNFILSEDKEFSFYPACLKGNFAIFFRKICYHSYTGESGEKK